MTGLKAKLYADRGYISQDLKSRLKSQDIDLITYHRKNMQAIQLSESDQYHLKQRNKIETLFSLLERSIQLVTSKTPEVWQAFRWIAHLYVHINSPIKISQKFKLWKSLA